MRSLLGRRRPLTHRVAAVEVDLPTRARQAVVDAAVAARALTADVDAALATRDTAIDARELRANRGQAGGYATLDADGQLPAGQFRTHSHAQAEVTGLEAALAARPAMRILHKTLDQARNLAALGDCTEMGFQAAPNTDYGILVTVIFQTAATSVGPRFSINGPADGLLTSWHSEIETAAGPSTSAVNLKSQIAPDAAHVVASIDQANTPRIARLQGTWRSGATRGLVTVRFGAEVDGTAITVKRGSWGLVIPLP